MVKGSRSTTPPCGCRTPGIGAPRYPASSDRDPGCGPGAKARQGRLSGLPDRALVEGDRIDVWPKIPDGSTAAPNPSLPALIKAELARFACRQLFAQVAVRLVVQAVAYGSMAFLLYRLHRTVEQVVAGLQNAPQEMLDSLRPGLGF